MGLTMTAKLRLAFFALVVPSSLAGCGLYTPDKDPFTSDALTTEHPATKQGNYESSIVTHVTCEIAQGLYEAQHLDLPWVKEWGTTVTQTVTAEDQSGLSPGISTIAPMQNVIHPFTNGGNIVSPQLFSLNSGASASANALRTETIQYTFRNSDIIRYTPKDCGSQRVNGVMIDGDLKIREFIYDKAQIAAGGNASLQVPKTPTNLKTWQLPPFNTFTEEITFVAAYGGSFTPTWKLARLTANASSNLLIGDRTNTNDLIITLGPLKGPDAPPPPAPSSPQKTPPPPPKNGPVELVASAMNQHNARVQASAIAVSIQGQTH